VAPIHENKMECTIDAVARKQHARPREEGRELRLAHLAGGRKVAVLN
jgi:hypothetical protein